ncbi:phosphopantetheine-binding protein [Paenibacillus sp. TH7-28]
MKKSEIFETIKNTLEDTLGVDEEVEVTLKSKLIDDLGAESIDLLDIMSRMERRFDVEMEKGEDIDEAIRNMTSEEELETGELPSEVLEALPALMPEIDPAEFKPGLRMGDLPRLFSVDSLIYSLQKALKEQKGIEIEDDMS